MNNVLKGILDESIKIFQNDPRILGAWHFGSIAKNSNDEYSDVDPVFLVKKEYFNEVDTELKSMFSKVCPNIHLWWAESFNDNQIKNYAILLESGDIYQYDLTIIKESSIYTGMPNVFFGGCKRENIIFDKDNVVGNNIIKLESQVRGVEELINNSYVKSEIERYWLFAFISVKYLLREDVFKVIYARDEMRGIHLNILRMSINNGDWSWWPESIKKNLDEIKRKEMLTYFGMPVIAAMKEDLYKQMDLFSMDAKSLCELNYIQYPDKLEDNILNYVKRHLL